MTKVRLNKSFNGQSEFEISDIPKLYGDNYEIRLCSNSKDVNGKLFTEGDKVQDIKTNAISHVLFDGLGFKLYHINSNAQIYFADMTESDFTKVKIINNVEK